MAYFDLMYTYFPNDFSAVLHTRRSFIATANLVTRKLIYFFFISLLVLSWQQGYYTVIITFMFIGIFSSQCSL